MQVEGSAAHSFELPHPSLERFVCKDGKESVDEFHERKDALNLFGTTVNTPEEPPL